MTHSFMTSCISAPLCHNLMWLVLSPVTWRFRSVTIPVTSVIVRVMNAANGWCNLTIGSMTMTSKSVLTYSKHHLCGNGFKLTPTDCCACGCMVAAVAKRQHRMAKLHISAQLCLRSSFSFVPALTPRGEMSAENCRGALHCGGWA